MVVPLNRRRRFKRLVDVLVASIALALLLPVLLAIGIAICLESPGPAIYSQERLGQYRRPFRIYKFRTMHAGAERDTGPAWSRVGDPRVTELGRALRFTHLDELPQLWNVMRGEMSLVGPRPERDFFIRQFEAVVPGYGGRFAILPGITGLSQIRSGYDTSLRSVRRKTRYDLLYAENESALLDVKIVLGTAFRMTRVAQISWQPIAARVPVIAAVFRRGQLTSWSESVPPARNAAYAHARDHSHRLETGSSGSAAAV
jgi:lipopolysaccharide/colanic/teichoic acid biosynthesis glycosyltransferase